MVAVADPSVGPVVAHITTTLPCPGAPSGFLTGYYTPSFSRNLVGVSHLRDLGVVTNFPLDEPVASCKLGAIGAPLATFHWEPGSGLYVLHTGSHHTESGQVSATPSRPGSPPPPSSHLAPSGVEGEGTMAAGAGGPSSGDAGGVGMEAPPVEDTAASSWRPRPTPPPGFPSVPQFPPHSSLQLVAAEPRGGPAGAAAAEGRAGVQAAAADAAVVTAGKAMGGDTLGATGAAGGAGAATTADRGGGAAATKRPAQLSTCTLCSWSPPVPRPIAAEKAEVASYRSTSTYLDAVLPPGMNVINGKWLYKVKRPPGLQLVFKVHYVARGFSHREGVDFFQTFAPTTKMTTLRVLLHIAAQRDNEVHSLDFSTAFLQGSLHE
ncbi:unnamed protein product [Closterium sp. NIES-54]